MCPSPGGNQAPANRSDLATGLCCPDDRNRLCRCDVVARYDLFVISAINSLESLGQPFNVFEPIPSAHGEIVIAKRTVPTHCPSEAAPHHRRDLISLPMGHTPIESLPLYAQPPTSTRLLSCDRLHCRANVRKATPVSKSVKKPIIGGLFISSISVRQPRARTTLPHSQHQCLQMSPGQP